MKKRAFSKEGQWAIYNRKAPATMQVALDAALEALADDPSLAERVGYRWAAPSLVERSQRPPSADLWSPLYCPTPEVWEPVIEARGDLSKHPLFPQELPRFCRVAPYFELPEFYLAEYPLTFGNLPAALDSAFEKAHLSREMLKYRDGNTSFLLDHINAHQYRFDIANAVRALQRYYQVFTAPNYQIMTTEDFHRSYVDPADLAASESGGLFRDLPAPTTQRRLQTLFHRAAFSATEDMRRRFQPYKAGDVQGDLQSNGLRGIRALNPLLIVNSSGGFAPWDFHLLITIRWKLKNPPPAEMLFQAPTSTPPATATATASAT